MRTIYVAFLNSWRGLRFGLRTERAVRQEAVLLSLGLPIALMLGTSLWVRVALTAGLLLVLATEYLNTSIERLCDHLHPDRHAAIGTVKDLGSAGVFLAQLIVALVWVGAVIDRFAPVA